MPPRRQPEGQPTRGKTAVNRLRRVDVFVALAMASVLRGGSPLVVDLGFGARPWTALELAERWRRVNPQLRVLGIEIDPERVAEALPFADPPRVEFARGGFDVESTTGAGTVRVVRCLNVLRQYEEAGADAALARIAGAIEPGGVLIEGTSSPSGRIVVFDVYRKRVPLPAEETPADIAGTAAVRAGLTHEALVFATNFRAPTDTDEFRTIAPKRLIHRMFDEAPARFFEEWQRASVAARAVGEPGTSRHWAETARLLGEKGWPLDRRKRLLERGFLVVRSDLRG